MTSAPRSCGRGARRAAALRGDGLRSGRATIGVVGHVALAVVFGLISWFFFKAASEYNANQARGLDGALRKLAAQPYGEVLLSLVAAGLFAYGVFCLVQARYREV